MTSLLSRQWLNLWLDTPVLTFRSPDPEARFISYVTWVNHVLQRHRGQYLMKFEIVCGLNNHYQKDIDNWLVFALSRKIECLELNLLDHGDSPRRSEMNYVFPDQLLKFSSGKANSNGGQYDLERLKHLSLKSVDVTCEAIDLFGCFFYIVHFLNDLRWRTLDLIELSNLDRLTKLKRLAIEVIASRAESMTMLISIINSCPYLEEFTLGVNGYGLERRNRTIRGRKRQLVPKKPKPQVF